MGVNVSACLLGVQLPGAFRGLARINEIARSLISSSGTHFRWFLDTFYFSQITLIIIFDR